MRHWLIHVLHSLHLWLIRHWSSKSHPVEHSSECIPRQSICCKARYWRRYTHRLCASTATDLFIDMFPDSDTSTRTRNPYSRAVHPLSYYAFQARKSLPLPLHVSFASKHQQDSRMARAVPKKELQIHTLQVLLTSLRPTRRRSTNSSLENFTRIQTFTEIPTYN